MHKLRSSIAAITSLTLSLSFNAHAQRMTPAHSDGTVLFICEHGTVKSLLAKVLFERYANEAGLPMDALSRGTAVDSLVPPFMRNALAADHFNLGAWQPRALAPTDLSNARYVDSFDVPAQASDGAKAPRAQWDGLPSVSQNYAAARDAISERVHRLVDSLKQARATRRP